MHQTLLGASNAALGEAQRLGRIGSWTWNVAEDLTTWSDELHRIFGHEPSLAAPSFAEHSQIYTAESLLRLQVAVGNALAGGRPYELELEFLRAEGSTGWLAAKGEAVLDDGGKVTSLRGTVQDISHQRALVQQLEQQHELLMSRCNPSAMRLSRQTVLAR